jgi:hypothetical protein
LESVSESSQHELHSQTVQSAALPSSLAVNHRYVLPLAVVLFASTNFIMIKYKFNETNLNDLSDTRDFLIENPTRNVEAPRFLAVINE